VISRETKLASAMAGELTAAISNAPEDR
jgi:hypothetical protein